MERDRVQSRVLVAVVGGVLAVLCCYTAYWSVRGPGAELFWPALAVSVVFAVAARALKAATPAAAACGGMVCLLVTFWTMAVAGDPVRSGLTPLVMLFLLTFGATKAGKQEKAAAGLAEGRRGRTASQILANLGAAGLCASPVLAAFGQLSLVAVGVLAALAEATADTVSSEVGQAFGGRPVLLTTLRRVEAGTDGAVSLLGSVAGVAGAMVVVLAGGWAMRMGPARMGVALVAGVAGLVFDSVLGATVERWGWLGNDWVNFASTVFSVGVAMVGGLLV